MKCTFGNNMNWIVFYLGMIWPLGLIRVFRAITAFDILSILLFLAWPFTAWALSANRYICYGFATILFSNCLTLLFVSSEATAEVVLFIATIGFWFIKLIISDSIIKSNQETQSVAWRSFLSGLIVSCLSLVIISVAAFISGIGVTGSGRNAFIFASSNGASVFGMFAVIVAVSGFFAKKIAIWFRIVSIMLMPSALTLTLLTGARGGVVFFLLSGSIFLIFLIKKSEGMVFWTKAIAVVASCVICLLFTWRLIQDNPVGLRINEFITSIIESDRDLETIDSDRYGLMREGWQVIIADMPIIGNGYESARYMTSYDAAPHNFFITVWYEQGLIGLLGYLIVYFAAIFAYYTRKKDEVSDLSFAVFFHGVLLLVLLQLLRTPFFGLSPIFWMGICPLLFMRSLDKVYVKKLRWKKAD